MKLFCNSCFQELPVSQNHGDDCMECGGSSENIEILEQPVPSGGQITNSQISRRDATNSVQVNQSYRLEGNSVGERYLEVNKKLANVIFTQELEGDLVFLDFEGEQIQRIHKHFIEEVPTADDLCGYLSEVLYGVLNFKGPQEKLFEAIVNEVRIWNRENSSNTSAPPTILLLSILSIAAENMSADPETGKNAREYYPRLKELLNLDDNGSQRFQKSYRKNSQLLWETLEEWLENRLRGSRGLGTAHSLGHMQHIGWPLSQALIVEADWNAIHKFYDRFNYPRSKVIPLSRVKEDLAIWINADSQRVSSRLKKLLDDKEPQIPQRIFQLIAEGALNRPKYQNENSNENRELERHRVTDVFLFGQMNSDPITNKRKLKLYVGIENQSNLKNVEIHTGPGERLEVDFFEANELILYWNPSDLIQWSDLLAGNLTLNLIFGESDPETVERIASKIIIFEKNLGEYWIETDRIPFNSGSLLLIHDSVYELVKELLTEIAYPTFKEPQFDSGTDIPDSWHVIEDVRLNINEEFDLGGWLTSKNVLKSDLDWVAFDVKTSFQSETNFSNGFLIETKRNRTTWHSDHKPTYAVFDQEYDEHNSYNLEFKKVSLENNEDSLNHKVEASSARTTWDFSKFEDLDEGLYQIALNKKKEIHSEKISFASAQNPRLLNEQEILLFSPEINHEGHGDHHPLWMLNPTTESDERTGFQIIPKDLKKVSPESEVVNTTLPHSEPGWLLLQSFPEEPKPSPIPLQLNTCGTAHQKEQGGNKTWYCSVCGKYFPETAVERYFAENPTKTREDWEEKVRQEEERTNRGNSSVTNNSNSITYVPPTRSSSEPPVTDSNVFPLSTAFDALCYLRKGTYEEFKRIVNQCNPSHDLHIFADKFLRDLEAMGHLNVARDHDMKATQWCINNTHLLETHSQDWILVGFRNNQILSCLKKACKFIGWEYSFVDDGESLPQVRVRNPQNNHQRNTEIDYLHMEYRNLNPEGNLAFISQASTKLIHHLPTLSSIKNEMRNEANLTTQPVRCESQAWDHSLAKWVEPRVEIISGSKSGAYRQKLQFRYQYVYRDPSEVNKSNTLIKADRNYVRYFDALDKNQPLQHYDPETKKVHVPINCELPGLFHRALVISSGTLPKIEDRGNYARSTTVYDNISLETYNKIQSKLRS